MGDNNSMNEVAINLGDSIGEELDYEASDNIEHEDDALETIQHERIVKEVSNSDGERINNSSNSAEKVAATCEKVEEPKPVGDSDVKVHATKDEGQSNKAKNVDNKKVSKEKPLVGNTPAKSVCKPCNLVFENSRWLEKHNESGDHTHVIKGFNPGGGKYYCYLCWLGFEHSEMLLHHIKRSEHITRARRRGVSDVSIKPIHSKGSHSSQTSKNSDRVPHRSGSQSKKPSSQTHKSVGQSHKSSSLSHRHTSSSSHRSRSPLRIRLSDYYEVSSVGHCDTSGVRLKSLANGVHKSSKDAVLKSSEGKSIQKAEINVNSREEVTNNQEPKEEDANNLDSEEKIEASSRVLCTENGSTDPEEKQLNVAHNKHDLSDVLDTKPPDECETQQVVSVELSGEPANCEMES